MKWKAYTSHKEAMFKATHTDDCPWVIVEGNDKEKARIEAIRHVLSKVPYDDKDESLVSKIQFPGIVQPVPNS